MMLPTKSNPGDKEPVGRRTHCEKSLHCGESILGRRAEQVSRIDCQPITINYYHPKS